MLSAVDGGKHPICFFAVSYESVLISIHAPQWGATLAGTSLPVGGRFRSTHPQWGATFV